MGCTKLNEKAYFAGGCRAAAPLPFQTTDAIIDIYDSVNQSWSVDALSLARQDLAATAVNQRVLFAGGRTDAGISGPPIFADSCSAVVDILDTAAGQWTTAQLSEARYALAAASVGHWAVFAGGINCDGEGSNTVDIYDAQTDTWSVDMIPGGGGWTIATAAADRVLIVRATSSFAYDPATKHWDSLCLNHGWSNGRSAIACANEIAIVAGGDELSFGLPMAVASVSTYPEDCNGNGLADPGEIQDGSSTDCDLNGVPDECDTDCNGNGTPDACDISDGSAQDCNLNGVPDSCDIQTGSSQDLDGNGIPDECVAPALDASPLEVSLASGGTQSWTLSAGPQPIINFYLVLGSFGGTTPGIDLNWATLPLVFDSYFLFTLSNPNTPTHNATFGILSSSGTASASLVLPPNANPNLAGFTMHHAYLVIDASTNPTEPFVSFASNAVPLTLIP